MDTEMLQEFKKYIDAFYTDTPYSMDEVIGCLIKYTNKDEDGQRTYNTNESDFLNKMFELFADTYRRLVVENRDLVNELEKITSVNQYLRCQNKEQEAEIKILKTELKLLKGE